MTEEEVKRQRKALERSETFFRTKKFSHTEKTRKLCPEAVGHFCMRWGDHGQGGFESGSFEFEGGGYIQGGQPMDNDFALWSDLDDCYEGYSKAQEESDYAAMKVAIRKLKKAREFHSIDQNDERQYREDLYSEKKPPRKRKAIKYQLNSLATKIFLKDKKTSLLYIWLITYFINPSFALGVLQYLFFLTLFLTLFFLSYWIPVFYLFKFFGKKSNGMWAFLWTMVGWPLMISGFFKLLEQLQLLEGFIDLVGKLLMLS